jgi:eukaryotic-like serine/threonine-protein kinase
MPAPDPDIPRTEGAPPPDTLADPRTADSPSLLPGTSSRYRPVRLHARGGLGEVHLAEDAELGRSVALKRIQPRHAGQADSIGRFLREAEITARLEHPGIIPVHGLVRDEAGQPAYAMRFVEGDTLKQAVDRYYAGLPDRLAFRQLLMHFLAACNAVAYAHSRGVIHRDLKPSNVLLGKFGETLVVDWGLAKVVGRIEPAKADAEGTLTTAYEPAGEGTQLGQALGTPAFMSPEQAAGRWNVVGPATDVYGLGATLYYLLAGQAPFSGSDTPEVLSRVQRGAYPAPRQVKPGVPRALDAVCRKALALEAGERYPTATALAREVERWLADEPVAAHREPLAVRAGRWLRRHRTLVTGAAAALVMAVAGLTAVLGVQARANRDLAGKNVELEAAAERERQRFDLALEAIGGYHTGVSEDLLLNQEHFKVLRNKLLGEAAKFYGKLEALLQGQTDARSRRALGDAYYRLGLITDQVGSKTEALKVHQQALAVRRELAAEPEAAAQLAVVWSLLQIGLLQLETGDIVRALASCQEARELAKRQAESADSTGELREALGGAYDTIASVLLRTGRLSEALAACAQAGSISQELADTYPGVTRHQGKLAASHHNIGNVLTATGKWSEALAAYERARMVQQRLADADPANKVVQQFLANHHNGIGGVLSATGKPSEALAAFERARAIRQKLAKEHRAISEYQSDLAASHFAIGHVLQETGQLPEALAALERAQATYQKLADDHPTEHQYRSALNASHGAIGSVLRATGKRAEALAAYQQALAIQQRLADDHPAIPDYRRILAFAHTCIGCVLNETGKPSEALAAYQQALAIQQKLADDHPAAPGYRTDLATSVNNLGRLHAREQRFADAFPLLDQSLAVREALVKAHPTDASYANHLGYSHAYRGWARWRVGQPDAAAVDLRRAIDLWAKGAVSDQETRFERARALALLAGLGGDAKSGVTAAEAAAFADRASAALTDAVAAGWANAAELKESDFNALRGRDDFRKVVAGLERKAKPQGNPNAGPPTPPK